MKLVSCACVLASLIGLTAPASAGDIRKHSGAIVSIADDGATFVLAEVGPWRVVRGETVITYRAVEVTPGTLFAVVARKEAAPSGFPGDFVESAVGPEWIYLHDYVTVDCRHEGDRLVALKITAVDLAVEANGGGGR